MNLFNRKIWLILVLTMTGWSSFAQAQGIRVIAAAQKTIYASEPFAYQITIDGYGQPGTVDLSSLKDFSPRSTGGKNITKTRIDLTRRTEQKTRRYAMSYQLTSSKAGKVIIPPVKVVIEGNAYTTNPVEINVLTPATSNQLDLEVFFTETMCYVGQSLTMTVNWYVDIELVRRVGEFHFDVPILLEHERFFFEEANIDVKTSDEPFQMDVGGEQVIATQNRVRHKGKDCVRISFSRILIPRQVGEVNMPGPKVICKIDISQRPPRSRSVFDFDSVFDRFDTRQYRRYLSKSRPISLTVRPLPQQGQPSDFNGLVGRYSISTSARPARVNVGDPVTLTINISGEMLKHVNMPDLQKISPMVENFKIPSEQSAPKMIGKQKVFTQTIRATNEQVTEIPPLPLSYFDVDKTKYVTVYSEAIPLEVTPTKIITARQAIGGQLVVQTSEIEAVRKGIAANYEGPELIRNAAFSPLAALVQPGYLILWLIPPGIFVVFLLIKKAKADDPARRKAQKKAAASRTAITRLRHVKGQNQSVVEQTANILRQYIGDRFDKTAPSLTARDCREILTTQCSEEQYVEQFCRALERCEQSRFAGGLTDNKAINPRTLSELIKTLDRHLKT